MPAWLNLFMQMTFFDACAAHQLCKNELNKYCIDCGLPLCQYCVQSGSHHERNVLKIYRHVYKDVVPISEMINYIDCSKIQPYKSNKLWVSSLKPLPHNNGSGSQAYNADSACQPCRRILNHPSRYHYCSLTCMVEAFSRKNSSDPPFPGIPTATTINNPTSNAEAMTANAEAKGTKRKRSQKGTPHRAPFF